MTTADVNLTVAGTSGTVGGAVFTNQQAHAAGTGVFNSFVQIQHTGTEQGYNTDAAHQYDEKSAATHNHSVLLADIPIVLGDGANGTQEGVAYREFLFDANEAGGTGRLLSLDKLQIWQEESGSLSNFTPGTGFAGSHTNYLAYNLDAGADHWIALDAGLSSGSGGSDMRVLIPDSYFINDPAHRYVTLYSAFGIQGGAYAASGGFEEWALNGPSGGPKSALVINESAAVPGGTADSVGEVVTYTITVGNVGNTTVSGLTVTATGVSGVTQVTSGGFNVGDTNHDGKLNAGETWTYTGQHTVTQSDINTNGGGDGLLESTATADSDQTTPISASASVAVERKTGLEVKKTADVSAVHNAGDQIHYTVAVANTGNSDFTDVAASDPQVTQTTPIVDVQSPVLGTNPLLVGVLVGDYNIGDLNQNGIQDPAVPPSPSNPSGTPAEVFVYRPLGDDNQNGVQDPGETFAFTNIGDTNQNGVQDAGETFQFYNAGDTNHNGVEDVGETFQVIVGHAIDPLDANNDGFNDGDANHDGKLNVGETWLYTVNHTVTQAEIDNGGVVDPALKIDNTASAATHEGANASGSVSVAVVQNPHLALTKTATVAGGTADHAGEVVQYAIAVQNDGNMSLTGVAVTDASVTGLAAVDANSDGFNDGDANHDGKLSVGETWNYTATHTVTQAEIDNGGVVDPALKINNTASVDTDQTTPVAASASVSIGQNPHVTLTKAASVPGGTADAAGEVIDYTITVTNDGNMTLTSPVVSDPFASNLHGLDANADGYNDGDLDHDRKLDLTESWVFKANHTVTQAEIDAGGSIANTASVTTGQGAGDSDSASVAVERHPSLALTKVGTFHDVNGNGFADEGIDTISFVFTVTNTGNTTQQEIGVSDPDGAVAVSGAPIASLAPGASDASWTGLYTITNVDVANGAYDDEAVATSLTANATATAHVVLPAAPPPPAPTPADISVMASWDQPFPV